MNTPSDHDPQFKAKQAAGKAAADLIQDGMLIGLGTGSTANFFIENLGRRCKEEGLSVKAFPTSERSAKLAARHGIQLCDRDITFLDITVDGADEIDHQKRMIKGGGGALLREKILASMSGEMIVIVDEHKVVNQLGRFPLPLEMIPFAYHATWRHISEFGYQGKMRHTKDGELYVTDNGNYIVDIDLSHSENSPEQDQEILSSIPGVVETGFFFNLAGRVIVGHSDGRTTLL
jgi:ribose 5-phosphate isomerase A